MFKMRHHLDASSVDALSCELQNKLGGTVRGFINPVDIDILEDIGLPYPEYNTNVIGVNIYVEDEYPIARALIATYGDEARKKIANYPDYQYIINQLDDVRRGLCSYTIGHDTLMDFGVPCIWRITNDTISGTPGFGNDRWFLFRDALDHNVRHNNEYLTELIESRKQLYKFLKPLLVDPYIYYYPDYVEEQAIEWSNYFKDIPQLLTKLNLEIFDLSGYILNTDSKQIYNSQETEYIIRDDFKDLK